MAWKACGLLMHWKPHWNGWPPPAMHWKKQVMSSTQSGEPKQPRICAQQFSATQSPHAEPSLGQAEGPQKPATHSPEQHSSGPPHSEPSGAHCEPQTLSTQLLLQQSSKVMQPAPSGKQASTQAPPSQVPEQQSGPVMQASPSGVQALQSTRQFASANATQPASQALVQQVKSSWHTAATHALHSSLSAEPVTHTSWAQGFSGTQVPAWQLPLQQSSGPLHIEPLGLQLPQPQSSLASSTHS